METQWFVVILALGTLCAILAVALLSKRGTDRRRKDPSAPKSSLAADGPAHRKAD